MAMPQAEAFEELRRDQTGRFFPDVIDALEKGLRRTGEIYGGPGRTRSELAEEARIG